ncbi:hypothetical protein HMPREF1980_01998, partial [Actinomyces sp. oral taxon 172 str. F0311]
NPQTHQTQRKLSINSTFLPRPRDKTSGSNRASPARLDPQTIQNDSQFTSMSG